MMKPIWIAAVLAMSLSATTVAVQEKQQERKPATSEKSEQRPSDAQPATGTRPTPVPLKVTVVLSRFRGDKKISSLPYAIGVAAGVAVRGPATRLRMGSDVPVVTARTKPEPGGPVQNVSYRDVGTNIDCIATALADGQFELVMTVSDSSVYLEPTAKPQPGTPLAEDTPTFRNFNSTFTALLRDGQTAQYTSATDPVTGEVMKIDVTLNVMK